MSEQENQEQEVEFASLDELAISTEEDSTEQLDGELDQTPDLDETEFKVPDKFKDKSINDVITSYTQLESEFGRRNNEVGELRKLTDELLNLQNSTEQVNTEEVEALSVDTLLEDPSKALSDALDNHPKFKAFEKDKITQARAREKSTFEETHEDWQEVVGGESFRNWIQESPVRLRQFTDANKNYDYATGAELISNFKAIKGVADAHAEEKKETKAKKDLKGVTLETKSTPSKKSKVYKRSDLINLKITNPSKYKSMEVEIMKAYNEGRVR